MPAVMRIKPARLSVGDWLNGAASMALLITVFALPWYGYRPAFRAIFGHGAAAMNTTFGHYRANGWQTFTVLGPLAVVVAVLGVLVWWLYATRPSPALPMALSVLQAPLSGALTIALFVRVLLAPPEVLLAGPNGGNALEALPGAYLGLGLSVAIAVGIYLSFRHEGVAAADTPGEIEAIDLSGTRSASRA